jgi:hypothetical protein
MTINVTPIPRLIDLAAPAFTLGTANAAGTAVTAVASDATLLAFDTTDPAAVAASAAVGSATTVSHRDHVHAGTTATGTVVDEAITRFDGTGGASLQGYSSLSPTISDSGAITLTSGSLTWPATAIASGGANTLDDYEEGDFTPVISDNSGAGGGYAAQVGRYVKIGKNVFWTVNVTLNSLTGLTGTEEVQILGLPFTSDSTGVNSTLGQAGQSTGLVITAGHSYVGTIAPNSAVIRPRVWDATTGNTAMLISELSASAALSMAGMYQI